MDASRLDQRITLRARTPSRDACGQVVDNWADVATTWARIVPRRAGAGEAQAEPVGTALVDVTIRRREGLTAGMQFAWGGQAWDITGQPLHIDRRWTQFAAQLAVRDAATVLPLVTTP